MGLVVVAAVLSPTDLRKQEFRIAMGDPVVSQQRQCRCGEWQKSIFGSLAAMDVNHHALGIDIADLQVESFFQPQSERVDGPEVDARCDAALTAAMSRWTSSMESTSGSVFCLGMRSLVRTCQSRGSVKV